MISRMIGKIDLLEENVLHLNVNNIIYEIAISKNTYNELKETKDEEISIFIVQKIAETVNELYGFTNLEEKRLLLRIIKIPKVGHKTGINVFNAFSVDELILHIHNKDLKSLKAIKGFGPKATSELIEHLKNEKTNYNEKYISIKNKLIELGMNKDSIEDFLEDKKDMSEEDIIKEYFKNQ